MKGVFSRILDEIMALRMEGIIGRSIDRSESKVTDEMEVLGAE